MNKLPEFLTKSPAKMLDLLSNDIAVSALDEFDKNFEQQGFFSKNTWKKSDNKLRGGSTLVGKGGGRLRRSIYIKQANIRKILIASDGIPYASIHNTGGKITITKKMRAWAWSQHYKNKNKKDNMYKRIALTKKNHITIPKRQFIGNHPTLTQQTNKIIEEQLSKFFK